MFPRKSKYSSSSFVCHVKLVPILLVFLLCVYFPPCLKPLPSSTSTTTPPNNNRNFPTRTALTQLTVCYLCTPPPPPADHEQKTTFLQVVLGTPPDEEGQRRPVFHLVLAGQANCSRAAVMHRRGAGERPKEGCFFRPAEHEARCSRVR